MLIDCPGCARSYHVSDAELGSRGRTVVCPRCDARWYQDAGGTIGGANNRGIDGQVVSLRPHSGLDELPAPPRSRLRPSRPVLAAGGAALAALVLAGAVLGRETVVAHMPRTAALYARAGLPVNVVGLDFANVRSERLASTDVTVRGTLRNVVGRRVPIPRLSFEVRDASGTMLLGWSESVPAHTLAGGRRLDFASQPHQLPAQSRTVLVRLD